MHEIYELKGMLCEELEKYGAKGDLSAGELEIVDKLAHTVKNLIEVLEADEEEYSGNMSYRRDGGNNRTGGNSYARGRGRNARRDSMGRYSSEYGYSRHGDEMTEQLRMLMEDAPNESIRRDIEKLLRKVEQM